MLNYLRKRLSFRMASEFGSAQLLKTLVSDCPVPIYKRISHFDRNADSWGSFTLVSPVFFLLFYLAVGLCHLHVPYPLAVLGIEPLFNHIARALILRGDEIEKERQRRERESVFLHDVEDHPSDEETGGKKKKKACCV